MHEASNLPDWSWNILEQNWLEGLRELKNYINEYGEACPLGGNVSPSGFKLGFWVGGQRKRSKDFPEYYELLNKLPGWRWKAKVDQISWEESFD